MDARQRACIGRGQTAGGRLTAAPNCPVKIDEDFLVLRHEATQLTLDPWRGGAIRDFSWRGQDIFRPTPADAGDDPFDVACFPMVPYANRVANGRFNFAGRAVQLETKLAGRSSSSAWKRLAGIVERRRCLGLAGHRAVRRRRR